MGVIQSLPLCSRGDKEDDGTTNDNNNQPMPSLQPQAHVVAVQPLSASQLERQTSIANPNAVIPPPEATSTPKLDRDLANAERERSYSSSLESNPEGAVVDDEDITGTDDSGLEQSSSDELELQLPMAKNKKIVTIAEQPERPLSAAGFNPAEEQDDGLQNIPLEDEGINESLDVTIPMENHETCESDEDDEDEMEDPVERPPEPTVPDERVDSTSSSSSSDTDHQPARPPGKARPVTKHQRKTGAGDTTSAITNILSEIVGSDHPYQDSVQPGFETAIARESATGR